MKALVLAALAFVGCASPQSPAALLDGGAPAQAIGDGRGSDDAPRQRYLALGDSFTIGTGTTPDRSMPALLASRWRAAGCSVVLKNLGVNGYTTDDLITEELPEVRRFAPTRVTVAVGANDIVRGRAPEEYRTRVKTILAALVADGVAPAHIFVLPQPEWSSSPAAQGFGYAADLLAQITLFNQILRDEATASGARWVDLTARMHQQAAAGMLAPDGLHPNVDAYDEWAADVATLGTPCAEE
jgi:lysophospholipase L1-like esterase